MSALVGLETVALAVLETAASAVVGTPVVAALQWTDPVPQPPIPAKAPLNWSSFESLLKHLGKTATTSHPGIYPSRSTRVFLERRRHVLHCDRLRKRPAIFCNRQKNENSVSSEADYKYVSRLRQVCFYKQVTPRLGKMRKRAHPDGPKPT